MTFLATASGLIIDNVRSTAILFELRQREIDETDDCNMRSSYGIMGQSADRYLIRKHIGRSERGRRCPGKPSIGRRQFVGISDRLQPRRGVPQAARRVGALNASSRASSAAKSTTTANR